MSFIYILIFAIKWHRCQCCAPLLSFILRSDIILLSLCIKNCSDSGCPRQSYLDSRGPPCSCSCSSLHVFYYVFHNYVILVSFCFDSLLLGCFFLGLFLVFLFLFFELSSFFLFILLFCCLSLLCVFLTHLTFRMHYRCPFRLLVSWADAFRNLCSSFTVDSFFAWTGLVSRWWSARCVLHSSLSYR